MNVKEERDYYMVRAMNSAEEDFDVFIKNDVVAVGWSCINFTKYINNFKNLKEDIVLHYYSDTFTAPQVIGRKINQVYRFCKIKSNDLIVVPYWNQILLATATGQQIYSRKDKSNDLSNQQKVEFQKNITGELKTVSRNSLSEALQRRLRVRGSTVSDLWEFADEIENIFSKDSYSYKNDFLEKEKSLLDKSKETLLYNIRNGKTNLQAGGIGLEFLIQELFECEGYEAKICSKKRFPGWADADIEASKDDRFIGTQKILAQIKHHQGVSSEYGLNQLLEIQKLDEYSGYKLIFITTAETTNSVKLKAEQSDIILMDGKSLIDWIFDNISCLKEETKHKLRISTIPQIN